MLRGAGFLPRSRSSARPSQRKQWEAPPPGVNWRSADEPSAQRHGDWTERWILPNLRTDPYISEPTMLTKKRARFGDRFNQGTDELRLVRAIQRISYRTSYQRNSYHTHHQSHCRLLPHPRFFVGRYFSPKRSSSPRETLRRVLWSRHPLIHRVRLVPSRSPMPVIAQGVYEGTETRECTTSTLDQHVATQEMFLAELMQHKSHMATLTALMGQQLQSLNELMDQLKRLGLDDAARAIVFSEIDQNWIDEVLSS